MRHTAAWFLFLAFVVICNYAQAMEQTTIDAYAGYFERYGWPITAIVISPLLSWRFLQWAKLTAKRVNQYSPSALTLDISGFLITFGLTYYAWALYAKNAFFVALIVGMFHAVIVKLIFVFSPEKIVNILKYGSENKVLAVMTGKDRRSESRIEPDSEDITPTP